MHINLILSMNRGYMKENINRLKEFFKKINDDNISEYAAECAFFTILSFFPAMIFLVSILKYISIDKDILLIVIKEFIPKTTNELIITVVEEIYSKSFKVISISAIITLWSAGKGFFSLCKFFRRIYKISDKSNSFFIRIEGVIYTFIFMIILIISLFLFVFGNNIHEFLEERFYSISIISSFLLKIRFILIIFILFLIFIFLYRVFAKEKIKIKYQLPGAFFSSIAWYICSLIFSSYAEIFGGFTNIYGSLSNIILIMLWIYASVYIILIGAEINKSFYSRK